MSNLESTPNKSFSTIKLGDLEDNNTEQNEVYSKIVQVEDVLFQNIKVGDILELKDEEFIPADCIFLWAENVTGQAYVSTPALDGEAALKPKQSADFTQQNLLKIISGKSTARFSTESIEPCKELYTFKGQMNAGD